MAPEEGLARERSDGGGLRRIDAKPEDRATHGNLPIDAIGASTKGAKRCSMPRVGQAGKKDLTGAGEKRQCQTCRKMNE